MNEQEKALQGMIEFCQWLIPNAKQLGLENLVSVQKIAKAQDQNELIEGINSLYKELGEDQFITLTEQFAQSKMQKYDRGGKLTSLMNRLKRLHSPKYIYNTTDNGVEIETRDDNASYHLNTVGADSLMWRNSNDGVTYTLSNSGPDKTWVGYKSGYNNDGGYSIKMSDRSKDMMKHLLFKKLGIK